MLLRLFSTVLRAGSLAALVFAGLAWAEVPGPHRALTPELAGMVQVAPRLHVDAPGEAARVQALIAAAERRTAAFFGPLQADPVWVVCTTRACAEALALRANGMTYAAHLIVIGPRGVNPIVLTHERIHAELHRHVGLRDVFGPRFPAWFDEGLAAHLSGDARLFQPDDPRAADWIREARDWFSWRRLREGRDWRASYGAAARLVAEIEDRIGADGLRALIDEVDAGADFDAALARRMGG